MSDAPTQILVRHLTQHHQPLYRYIYSLVGNATDSSDILQETSVALFQKLEQYDQSKPFLPWAYRFAYIEVMKWRKKAACVPVTLDDDVIELLAGQRDQHDDVFQQRMTVLPKCFEKLPVADRAVVKERYFDNVPPNDLAQRLGFSRRTLYRELERIRTNLMDCIQNNVSGQGI